RIEHVHERRQRQRKRRDDERAAGQRRGTVSRGCGHGVLSFAARSARSGASPVSCATGRMAAAGTAGRCAPLALAAMIALMRASADGSTESNTVVSYVAG